MHTNNNITLGLALSGSGNRTSFYVGFFERLQEADIKIDYIAAMSGASLVAAAYAAGKLPEFKELVMGLNKDTAKKYLTKSSGGGLYSLRYLESFLREMYGGLQFEEARPQMAFVAADIETGQQVLLCMGDVARAACISCTLPGVFEPVRWGGRTLVDGGLLSQIPMDVLKGWNVDISVAVNMRGTKHIFTEGQMTIKKIINAVKKYLFIDEITSWWAHGFGKEEDDEPFNFSEKANVFSVIGRSLDIAIKASAGEQPSIPADILIEPFNGLENHNEYNEILMKEYYELGRASAEQMIPKLRALIAEKEKVGEAV